MIKNLIAAAMASILITQPPQNANDETYYQDVNITESYEYETNEVNSVDDLVVGNIYHCVLDTSITTSGTRLTFSGFFNLNYDISINNTIVELTEKRVVIENGYDFGFYIDDTAYYINLYNGRTYLGSYYSINKTLNPSIEFEFLYSDLIDTTIINNISASDYLGEKTITIERVETEGLYNLAYHFLYSRIYTNTELQSMETTLFGTTINMNMWLSHTTAIVIICLLLIVLIKFVIWLFKIVSGGMLWQ